jgi:hypothetical protein
VGRFITDSESKFYAISIVYNALNISMMLIRRYDYFFKMCFFTVDFTLKNINRGREAHLDTGYFCTRGTNGQGFFMSSTSQTFF